MPLENDHVSCRVFNLHRRAAAHLGTTLDDLLGGTGIHPNHLEQNRYVPWSAFLASVAILEERMGGLEALTQFGRVMNQRETFPFYGRIFRNVLDLRLLAEVMSRWVGPSVFPCLDVRLRWRGRHRLFFEVRVPEHLEGSRTFLTVGLACMQSLPMWHGLPDSEGAIVIENERYGWADLTLPRRSGLRSKLGRAIGYVGSSKRLIEELLAQNEALRAQKEALVRATREAEVQRRRAERASRIKSDFVAAVSHEMRTPLNALQMATHLLASGELDDGQREQTEVVLRAARHMTRVLEDLIDLEAVEAGHLRFDAKPFSPRGLAHEVAAMLRSDARARGLSLDVEVEGDVPPLVVGDAARVRQLLLNLVSNAIRYTAEGGARIHLSLVAQGRLRMEVSDTGPGLDEKERRRIFEPFVQGRARASSRGAGLGLAIFRHLVVRMGGEVGVESVLGEGSTFWCELPLAACEEASSSARIEARQEKASARSHDVLLVEDDELTRKVFTLLLRSLGCQVEIAEDGARAIERCAERRYDLVLMDCQMPIMGGLEATRAIRSSEGPNRDTCIVGLTAGTREATPSLWAAAGMTTLLHKPLDTAALRVLLDSLPGSSQGACGGA